jgi:hypothetical protein
MKKLIWFNEILIESTVYVYVVVFFFKEGRD